MVASIDLTTTLSSAFLISWGRVTGVSAAFFDTPAVFDPPAADSGAGGGGGADSANWFSRLLGEAKLGKASLRVALGGGDPQLGKAMAEDKLRMPPQQSELCCCWLGLGLACAARNWF